MTPTRCSLESSFDSRGIAVDLLDGALGIQLSRREREIAGVGSIWTHPGANAVFATKPPSGTTTEPDTGNALHAHSGGRVLDLLRPDRFDVTRRAREVAPLDRTGICNVSRQFH